MSTMCLIVPDVDVVQQTAGTPWTTSTSGTMRHMVDIRETSHWNPGDWEPEPSDLPPGRRRPDYRERDRVRFATWLLTRTPENRYREDPDYSEVVSLPITRGELEVLRRAIVVRPDPVTPDVVIARAVLDDLDRRVRAIDDGAEPAAAFERHNLAPDNARFEDEWTRTIRVRTVREERTGVDLGPMTKKRAAAAATALAAQATDDQQAQLDPEPDR